MVAHSKLLALRASANDGLSRLAPCVEHGRLLPETDRALVLQLAGALTGVSVLVDGLVGDQAPQNLYPPLPDSTDAVALSHRLKEVTDRLRETYPPAYRTLSRRELRELDKPSKAAGLKWNPVRSLAWSLGVEKQHNGLLGVWRRYVPPA